MKYSIIIPVYNESPSLRDLYYRLIKVISKPYEIIFVDDGSKDSSYKVLCELKEIDSNIEIIRFTRNFGQHAAVMAGLEESSGDVRITIDADLQNPPEEIPKLLDKLHEGYDVVFGIFEDRKHSAFRRFGSWFSKLVLSKILPVEVTSLSGFRVMKSKVAVQLMMLNEKSRFIDGLICWMGFKVGMVNVKHDKRTYGKTKYSLFKLINMWLDMVVSLTDIPLRIATFSGFFIGTIGFLLAIFYGVRYFMFGYPVQGFATTVILITVFAGFQLVCLGILGEYIGRMNKEVKNKPDYIIREIK